MTPPQTLVRPAAVAGTFYPADPSSLVDAVRGSFAAAKAPPHGDPDLPVPEALVVPHAGYAYSGPVAASAYHRLLPGRDLVRRVVLLGPSHRVPVRGLVVPVAGAFATPLGLVPVDRGLRRAALDAAPFVTVDDLPHAAEHSLEVQIPFLQTVLDGFELLPLAVGHASAEEVAAVLDAVWGGAETVVVVSTDLSHYHPYADAQAHDARTAAAVTALEPDRIADTDACGAHALRGLLLTARRRGLRVEQLDLRNSGDTAGDHDRVVGYAAFAVTAAGRQR